MRIVVSSQRLSTEAAGAASDFIVCDFYKISMWLDHLHLSFDNDLNEMSMQNPFRWPCTRESAKLLIIDDFKLIRIDGRRPPALVKRMKHLEFQPICSSGFAHVLDFYMALIYRWLIFNCKWYLLVVSLERTQFSTSKSKWTVYT